MMPFDGDSGFTDAFAGLGATHLAIGKDAQFLVLHA
jgi:hypothetical protein